MVPGPGMKMQAAPVLARKIIPTNEIPVGPPGPKGIYINDLFYYLQS